MALFISFASRAVPFDLVSDLSSQAFIAALRRFVSRGCPQRIFSDNGTNFTGAQAELEELQKLLIANHSDSLQAFFSKIVCCLDIFSSQGSSFWWLVGSGHKKR